MDIQRFIATRKALGFSQKKLSEGICTQVTLSRFENNGQIPTIKILIRLCNRLQLNLGELFPNVGIQDSKVNKQLDQSEFYLVTREYCEAAKILNQIPQAELQTPAQKWHYLYLKGYLSALQSGPVTETFFYLNQILSESPKEKSYIFVLLAYTGLGIAYANEADKEKAEYFFEKAVSDVYHYPIETSADIWRVLNILFYCGTFYASIKDYNVSDALLEHGVTICSDNHVTYYLARLMFQLAKNALVQNKALEVIREYVADAQAFAKINQNTVELRELKVLQARLDKREQ
ncbi:helix-turn-helix domain-containing protein [Enterococcus pingfangensis]|uniref:helix-turn-helix domain-containing protein n=1 Tax=Enterococcus pingfangensis TaxID=2559924 RepID=UPI0010FA157E|nr:helix-turn-helix transcriptional regulator [Enterococcus pingfangensis]